MSNAEIGLRIYERRKELGITQEQLAELLDTTPQAISNYERGTRELKAGMIVTMAKVLRVSADYLLTGSDAAAVYAGLSDEKRRLLQEIHAKCLELAAKP